MSLSAGAAAQLNYKSGYVISLKNDTLYGLVNDGGGLKNARVCLYKKDRHTKAVRYSPSEIKAYRFAGDKYYHAEELFYKGEFSYIFTDVLLKGDVSLYYDRRNRQMSYYLERKEGEPIGLINEEISIKRQNDYGYLAYGKYKYGVVLNVYKDTLFSFFKDSEKIGSQVGNVEYNQKSLFTITKAYLDETCKGYDCISYEKDFRSSRESFGVYSGISFSRIDFWEERNILGTTKKGVKSNILYSIPVGVFYNVPLKLLNDRLSFQMELLLSNNNILSDSTSRLKSTTFTTIQSKTIGIPLLLKYQIPLNKITPGIAIGKENNFVINSVVKEYDLANTPDGLLHKTQKGGWFFEVGADYKLRKGLSLFSNIRVQSYYNLLIDSDGYANNFSFSTNLNEREYSMITTYGAALHVGVRF
jgi:hypothetical protein